MCFVFQIYCWFTLVDMISMWHGENSKIITSCTEKKKIQSIIGMVLDQEQKLPGQKFYSFGHSTLDTGRMNIYTYLQQF
jgi:hypothetical protein